MTAVFEAASQGLRLLCTAALSLPSVMFDMSKHCGRVGVSSLQRIDTERDKRSGSFTPWANLAAADTRAHVSLDCGRKWKCPWTLLPLAADPLSALGNCCCSLCRAVNLQRTCLSHTMFSSRVRRGVALRWASNELR